jgi:glycerol transport system ATP-binding protein
LIPAALQLLGASYRSGADTWLYPLDLSLAAGEINVLLGETRAGKTTLLRLMAGLDRVTSGAVLLGDRDVTDIPVRQRNVAMVYQQFINYPSLTVYENIASPLRLARRPEADVRTEVTSLAEALHLTAFLDRYPSQLSGGQQQRTALARALAKRAELLLLDEPLVNLDYKLREQLREELRRLFSERGATVVYATTEPQEALQLGGRIAVLSQGRLLQSGPTLEVFRRPANVAVARTFSDPPFNMFEARIADAGRNAVLSDGTKLPLPVHPSGTSDTPDIMLGVRAHQLSLAPSPTSCTLLGRVALAEKSGSDTYLHFACSGGTFVAQLPGVHDFSLGDTCSLHIEPAALFGFDRGGALLFAPQR